MPVIIMTLDSNVEQLNVILKFYNVTQILVYWQQMAFIVIKLLTLSRNVSSLVDELLSVQSASCYPLKTELNDGV